MEKKIFALILQCFSSSLLFSQIAPDSIPSNVALQNTINFYYSVTKENAHLYIGSEYAGYDNRVIGNPFFDTATAQNGSIYYNGTFYRKVPMLYDILNDDILVNRYNQYYFIRLAKEKIGYFSILTHNFIRIVPDSNNKALPRAGFYDVVYNGKTEVLVKREKTIKDDQPITYELISRYIQHNSFFVKIQNTYFEVSTKKSLFKIFDSKYREIRSYLKKNKIKFRKQPELAIIKAAQYYDLLTN